MINQSSYIARAEEIIGSINIAELNRAGLSRDKHTYDFIVQYPPSLTLKSMNGAELYT